MTALARTVRRTTLLWGLCLTALAMTGEGLEGQDVARMAQDRLDYLIGMWDSTTEFLDADGNVERTDHSVNVIEPFIGTRVLLTTMVGSGASVRKSIRFFDQADERYYEIGIGADGDVWILSGGLDEYVTTSQPRPSPAGGSVMVRFTHRNIQPNSFQAFMEVSTDQGRTWRPSRTRETMVRRTPDRTRGR